MRGLSPLDQVRSRWNGMQPSRERLNGEGGAAIAMVALSMIVIMGAAALTIDIGNGYRIRRSLIPATDSGSLAAAQDFVGGLNGCDNGTAQSYVLQNEPAADVPVSCTHFPYPGGQQGRVTVTATHNVQTWFASVIGAGDYTVTSTSTAVYGPPAGVTGLRPMGLCLGGSTDLQNLVNNPSSTQQTLIVRYNKDQPDACIDDSSWEGNWGTIDLNAGGPSNDQTKEWVENGFSGVINYENHPVTSCSMTEGHCYEADPGALAGIQNELKDLKDSGQFFTLPVFNFAQDSGATPGRSLAHIAAILRVRLDDFRVVGLEANRFFEFTVEPGLVTGPCCGSGSGSSGNKVITICGVDPGQFAACDP